MPPVKKISREDIIRVGLKILENESCDSINARRIAKELGCSVQPIFSNFSSMEELKNILHDEVYKVYQSYMEKGAREPQGYKGIGLAYIRFAKDYPKFFKMLFMEKTGMSMEKFMESADGVDDIIKAGMEFSGLNYEEQRKFHFRVWLFTHGIATLLATDTIRISDEEVEYLLKNTVQDMLIGMKERNL